ncbi:MAG: segregation ATPase FtsK/SpoIIIE, family [Actinomycetota bacterium]|nr:segregation ATPase FtsK/SpoIIIE, family [Actinomycetota bacterium]
MDTVAHAPDAPVHSAECLAEQSLIVRNLQEICETLADGWSTAGWDWLLGGSPPLGREEPQTRQFLLRIGTVHPVSEGFPLLVPFLSSGHLAIDTDARDERVAGLLRGVLLRVLAAVPTGSVRVLPVDAGTLGSTFTPLLPLVNAELMTRPAIDLEGLRGVLTEAETHIRETLADQTKNRPILVVAVAALPGGCTSRDHDRLAALSRTGPSTGVHLLLAGWAPVPGYRASVPHLENTTLLTAVGEAFHAGDPPGEAFGIADRGLTCPIHLDTGPPDHLVSQVCSQILTQATADSTVNFMEILPKDLWQESSLDGLRTIVGRCGRDPAWLALDDATPHWLVGGRTGSGKTVFLLAVLYGLVSRYSSDEMALYLLDFKEGVSFSEFTPTPVDPSWIPHARTVGVESDREYGVAVLATLVTEMSRRASAMKQVGATRLAQLRAAHPDNALPRIVAVIDEFQVLFSRNDAIAKRATVLLEDIARKGRSYGIHLILASQTASGIEALLTKGQSIFGQFSQRVALAGGGGVLSHLNNAADTLSIGQVVLNDAAGVPSANRLALFPNTDDESVKRVRTALWNRRVPGDQPPAVFAGYDEQHIEDDPTLERLTPAVRHRAIPVGRVVDIGLPTALFTLDSSPGRHLAVLGPSQVGADILTAAVIGLTRQHEPGKAAFVLAGFVGAADDAVDEASSAVRNAGHQCSEVEIKELRKRLRELVKRTEEPVDPMEMLLQGSSRPEATYVVVWGADTMGNSLKTDRDKDSNKTGLDDLRTLLQSGPAHGIHLIGWWRVLRRLLDDLGPTGREDIAGLIGLNVSAKDFGNFIGKINLDWSARPNRALFIDRHEDTTTLVVPYVKQGRHTGEML